MSFIPKKEAEFEGKRERKEERPPPPLLSAAPSAAPFAASAPSAGASSSEAQPMETTSVRNSFAPYDREFSTNSPCSCFPGRLSQACTLISCFDSRVVSLSSHPPPPLFFSCTSKRNERMK